MSLWLCALPVQFAGCNGRTRPSQRSKARPTDKYIPLHFGYGSTGERQSGALPTLRYRGGVKYFSRKLVARTGGLLNHRSAR